MMHMGNSPSTKIVGTDAIELKSTFGKIITLKDVQHV